MSKIKNIKPIIFFVHGFKTVTWNNYDDFANWLKRQKTSTPDLYTYDYYSNSDKKTLKSKLMWEKNKIAFKGIVEKKRDIIIVGYSSGAPISTMLIKEFPAAKIKKVIFIAPAFKVSILYVVKKFLSGIFKKIILWFKMNKRQKKRYRRIKKHSVNEPHLYRIIISMLALQKRASKNLKNINLKEIEIFYGSEDTTISSEKNIKFILKNTKQHNTKTNFHEIKGKNHVSIFTNGCEKVFEEIIK